MYQDQIWAGTEQLFPFDMPLCPLHHNGSPAIRTYLLIASEYPAAILRGDPILSERRSSSRFVRAGREDGRREEKGRDFSELSVLSDNECFVRENPSTVTVGGGNVRESYGLLAFNPRGPAPQSN